MPDMMTQNYNCPELLHEIFNAIHELAGAPGQVVSIKFSDREVQYNAGNFDQLMMLYRVHWNACGQEAGLPPLDPSAATLRGGPVFLGY